MDSVMDERKLLVLPSGYVDPSPTRSSDEKSSVLPQILAAVSGSLVAVQFGFHTAWPSPALAKLLADDSPIRLTSSQGSWLVGLGIIGMTLGILSLPILPDRLGRKRTLLVSSVPYFIGSILIVFGRSYWWLYVARIFVGFGMGMSVSVISMYIGEVSEDRVRGAATGLINIMINVGVVVAYAVGPWVDGPTFASVGASMPFITIFILIWMPESPYYLLMKKKRDEARGSLEFLRGKKDVSEELKIIENSVEYDRRHAGTYKELLTIPSNRRAILVGSGLFIAQEFSGYLPIVSYSTLIFQASGAKLSSNLSIISVGIMQLVIGLVSVFFIDLFERRKLLIVSTLGTMFFLASEAVYFQLFNSGADVSSLFWLPVTGIVGFIICYTFGLGILTPCFQSELFAWNVKSKGMMIAVTATTFPAILVAKLYQVVADTYGIHCSFWMFVGLMVFSLAFFYFIVPETRNKSFREIQENLKAITGSKKIPEV